MAACKQKNKQVKGVAVPRPTKTPKNSYDTESHFQKTPIWAFSKCDFDHPKWGIANNVDLLLKVLIKLKALEGMSWNTILSDMAGRNKAPKNSEKEISILTKDAQTRVQELNLHSEHDLVPHS